MTVWVESERTGHYKPAGTETTLPRYECMMILHFVSRKYYKIFFIRIVLEQFSTESRKAETKVITLAKD